MIGQYTYIHSKQDLADRTDINIGRYCQIAEGVLIAPINHPSITHKNLVANFPFANAWGIANYLPCQNDKITEIGNDVWIGSNAIILSGITIGNGAVIGAGAIVTKDVPAFAIVVGVPAEVKKFRFDVKTIEKLQKIGWWNWNRIKVESSLEDFKDIKKFIRNYEK